MDRWATLIRDGPAGLKGVDPDVVHSFVDDIPEDPDQALAASVSEHDVEDAVLQGQSPTSHDPMDPAEPAWLTDVVADQV